MADGDVIVALEFDDGRLPDPRPPFEFGSAGAELYAAVAPLAYEDEAHGWPLAYLCEAIGRMRQAVTDIVRDREAVVVIDGREVTVDVPAWSSATDVEHAPGADSEIDLLPFLGQLVGVRGIENLDDRDRRDAIRDRDGFSRGQVASIVSHAQRFTDGGGVTLRERYNPDLSDDVDAPYHGRIVIKRSRVRDLARVNLVPNPRAQLNTYGTTVDSTGMLGVTLSRVTCDWHDGADHCFRVFGRQPNDTTFRELSFVINPEDRTGQPVTAGHEYTISAYVNVPNPAAAATGQGLRWEVFWFDADGEWKGASISPVWLDEEAAHARLSSTFSPPSGAEYGQFRLQQVTATANVSLAFELTAILLEESDRLGDFGDADTDGWRWLGTPYASSSQGPGVDAETLTALMQARIPAGLTFDVVISDDPDYTEIGIAYATYDELAAAITNYDDLLEG